MLSGDGLVFVVADSTSGVFGVEDGMQFLLEPIVVVGGPSFAQDSVYAPSKSV